MVTIKSNPENLARNIQLYNVMCDFKSKCATIPCHAEEADRLTKHLLPMHTVEAADSSTPLRSAQNDSALMTTDLEVTHGVTIYPKLLIDNL